MADDIRRTNANQPVVRSEPQVIEGAPPTPRSEPVHQRRGRFAPMYRDDLVLTRKLERELETQLQALPGMPPLPALPIEPSDVLLPGAHLLRRLMLVLELQPGAPAGFEVALDVAEHDQCRMVLNASGPFVQNVGYLGRFARYSTVHLDELRPSKQEQVRAAVRSVLHELRSVQSLDDVASKLRVRAAPRMPAWKAALLSVGLAIPLLNVLASGRLNRVEKTPSQGDGDFRQLMTRGMGCLGAAPLVIMGWRQFLMHGRPGLWAPLMLMAGLSYFYSVGQRRWPNG